MMKMMRQKWGAHSDADLGRVMTGEGDLDSLARLDPGLHEWHQRVQWCPDHAFDVSDEAEAFNDVWREYVMKHAMQRP